MKLLGGKWSRGDVLALLGVIVGVLALPQISRFIDRDSIPTGFVGTWYGVLNDRSDGSRGYITVVVAVGKDGTVTIYDRDHDVTRSCAAAYKNSVLSCKFEFASRGPRETELSTQGDGLQVRVLRVPAIDGKGPEDVFKDMVKRQE